MGCVGPTGIDQSCATEARATIKRNPGTMLAGLRAAAPHVPLVGMRYYNPFLGNWLAGEPARSLTLSTTPGLLALNHELARLYGGGVTHRTNRRRRELIARSVDPHDPGTPFAIPGTSGQSLGTGTPSSAASLTRSAVCGSLPELTQRSSVFG